MSKFDLEFPVAGSESAVVVEATLYQSATTSEVTVGHRYTTQMEITAVDEDTVKCLTFEFKMSTLSQSPDAVLPAFAAYGHAVILVTKISPTAVIGEYLVYHKDRGTTLPRTLTINTPPTWESRKMVIK
ncbi:hypothetical protein HDU86_003935 [Geranomyces michiganensis]|nr:hypothetical protein HDU86_003935 [Geranomyces michiganensis]